MIYEHAISRDDLSESTPLLPERGAEPCFLRRLSRKYLLQKSQRLFVNLAKIAPEKAVNVDNSVHDGVI